MFDRLSKARRKRRFEKYLADQAAQGPKGSLVRDEESSELFQGRTPTSAAEDVDDAEYVVDLTTPPTPPEREPRRHRRISRFSRDQFARISPVKRDRNVEGIIATSRAAFWG